MSGGHASAKPVLMQVDGLCFSYSQCALFKGWSARMVAGLTLLKGGDGRGKSTLLQLLAGVLAVQAGELQVHDIRLAVAPQIYRQQVFWDDARVQGIDQMTSLDYCQSLQRRYPRFDLSLAHDLMEGLALGPHRDKPLYMLSTGSRRKVGLAGAFASGAAVTLLDDPFAALDQASIRFVMELLQDAARHPTRAWIMACHEAPGDLSLAAILDLGD